MNFANRAAQLSDTIIADRRYLHQHAELSYQEFETTAYIVAELEKLGIPVQTFTETPGCIATIKGGQPGKTVMLRADIDALPIQENSGVDFESIHPGVMHACGHDCHAAMLLGAARLLWEQKDQLQGTVKLLFQAAEEVFVGSHYYWDAGHLNDVNAAMGMHVWPSVESGRMAVKDGPLMASCDNFKLTVRGVSAHGSMPHQGKDAIVAASAIITNFQTIVSRSNDPRSTLVVTVGMVHAGTQFNIITDTAVMEGTVRAFSAECRDLAEERIRAIAEATAAMYGCTIELEYLRLEPPVRNDDAKLNELARNSARTLYGDEVLVEAASVTGSEDFSYLMEKIPSSLFMFMGCRDEETGCVHPVHNEKFKVNENILHKGAAQYAQFAADWMEQNAGGEA